MHASHQHHEAFENAVEAFLAWKDGAPEPTVSLAGEAVTISRICGLMWNCSDILPSRLADSVVECEGRLPSPRRNTYGAAARLIRQRTEEVA